MKQLKNLTAIKKLCTPSAGAPRKEIDAAREYERQLLAAWERAESQNDPVSITINIEWRKSRTWGWNPHASAHACYKNTFGQDFKATTTGCGYDKESTVVASILNQCFAGVLLRAYRKGVKVPYGTSGPDTNGIYPPHFDGGVGMSCYLGDRGVIAAIGGAIEHTASGETFDAYVIKYPVRKKRIRKTV